MLKGCSGAESIPILSTNRTNERGVRFISDEMTCEGDTKVTCTELFIPTKGGYKLVVIYHGFAYNICATIYPVMQQAMRVYQERFFYLWKSTG